jgi:CYTH domain-containing protein
MGAAIPTTENTLVVESKYARVERERRFILREMPLPLTRASEHVQIWDNYITGTRLRLRKIRTPQTRKWTMKLTQKFAPSPPDFSRTIITNTYLSAYEYQVLSVFEGNEIRKNRYPFEYEGRKYSIDVFLGALWGLILAETDFETDEEMDRFTKPPFAVMDVTNEEMFTGGRLVDLTTDELRAELGRLLEKHQG